MVREAAFGYYGADEDDDPPRWQTDWPPRARLPNLVQIRLAFAAGDAGGSRRPWPSLVVAPRRNADF